MMVLQDLVYIALCSLPVLDNKKPMCSFNSTLDQSDYCSSNTAKLLFISHHIPSDCHVVFDNTFLYLIFPQVFNGLGQLLVNMTVLEFLYVPKLLVPCRVCSLVSGTPCSASDTWIMKPLDYFMLPPQKGVLIYCTK